MIYPVITLYQPWADWIMNGWKTIETRKHKNFKSLKGKTILIHAAQKIDNSDNVLNNPFLSLSKSKFNINTNKEYTKGCIIGSAFVYDFRLLSKKDSKSALVNCEDENLWGLFLNKITPFNTPMNHTQTKDLCVSSFIVTCLLLLSLKRVRSLTVTPLVYSQVPYEVLKSYTDKVYIKYLYFLYVKFIIEAEDFYVFFDEYYKRKR